MLTTDTGPACAASRTPVAEMAGTWWVAQVRPQYERKLAREMAVAGVDYFLPSELVKYSRKDRPGRSEVRERLLFPWYLFVNGDESARYEAASSPHTVRVIPVPQQAKLTKQLVDLDRALDAGVQTSEYRELVIGTRCRVRYGPLEGTEGVLIMRPDGGRDFVLVVTMLGQAVTLDVAPEYLESLN